MKKYLAVAFCAVALAFAGCSTGGAQPSRSQNQHNEFNHCNVTINVGAKKAKTAGVEGVVSNEVELAESGVAERAACELFTQTQNQEGSETVTPTQTNTTDTKPDIDVTVPVNRGSSVASGADSVAGAVGTLAAAATQGISNAMSKGNSGAAANCSGGNCATGNCSGGACSDGSCSRSGTCSDGSCSTCTDCTPK